MGENRVPELVTALVVLYTISFLFTALRVYVRVFVSKNWGADDTLLMATLVSSNWSLLFDQRYVTDLLRRPSSQYMQERRLLGFIMVPVVTFMTLQRKIFQKL
jgi:hypothetical protein